MTGMTIDEEVKFASKFFENIQLKDGVFYWMGDVAPKNIGWIVSAFYYFNIPVGSTHQSLIYETGVNFNIKNVKINKEWKEDPMKLFEFFWRENNDDFI